ncbi:MAG: branched-chain amino acid ABC transporter permease [Spirochaetes bacterium]|nr:branched-chain amino acid ABC transporter permease [Spirochaetota bacterium]
MKYKIKKYSLYAALIVGILLLVSLPSYTSSYRVIFFTNILMYVILTLSWVIFSGPTGYISLATAAFFGVGVYTSALFSVTLCLPLVIFIGGIASFCLAFIVGSLTLRLRGMYFTMFTFALVQLISNFANWYEVNITGTVGRHVISLDSIIIYYAILVVFCLVLLVSYYIRHSKYGLALQSIGESEEAAAHSGINVTLVKVITFATSAFFMGAVGAVMAMRWTYVDPPIAFDIRLSFMPLLMAIFGGMGNVLSPVMGATIFAYLEEILTTKFPYYYMLLFGGAMLLVIVFMPRGIEGVFRKLQKNNRRESVEKI